MQAFHDAQSTGTGGNAFLAAVTGCYGTYAYVYAGKNSVYNVSVISLHLVVITGSMAIVVVVVVVVVVVAMICMVDPINQSINQSINHRYLWSSSVTTTHRCFIDISTTSQQVCVTHGSSMRLS